MPCARALRAGKAIQADWVDHRHPSLPRERALRSQCGVRIFASQSGGALSGAPQACALWRSSIRGCCVSGYLLAAGLGRRAFDCAVTSSARGRLVRSRAAAGLASGAFDCAVHVLSARATCAITGAVAALASAICGLGGALVSLFSWYSCGAGFHVKHARVERHRKRFT
jgi:hypothetical protein